MNTVNIYLNFDGNCEEAFNFYKSVFGGEFSYVGRFGEMPPQEGAPVMSEEMANRIMHIGLPISNETMLMGSDTGGEWAPNLVVGNNFSISFNTNTRDNADRVFNALSLGGNATMPMMEQFWGDYFGMLTDKFGINWMVNCSAQQAQTA